MTAPQPLDGFDLKIIDALQRCGDLTRGELAQSVHLSPSQCSRRVQRLKERGIIRRIVAEVDRGALGFSVAAQVAIMLKPEGEGIAKAFRADLAARAEVVEVSVVAGEYDLMVKVVVRDHPQRQELLATLRRHDAVAAMRSSIVLEEIKSNGPLRVR